MPIRPENKDRYPKDWKTVVVPRIRARSGNRCECTGQCGIGHTIQPLDAPTMRCWAVNGEPHPITGSMVVLTTAHLGLPVKLPFFLHMTRYAVTDEVVDLVGLLVSFNTEGPEWRLMMNDRSTSELFGRAAASRAPFLIALPREPSSGSPRGTVVFDSAALPAFVLLSTFSLSGEPFDAAGIPTKSSPGSDMKSADLYGDAAALAAHSPEAALCSTYGFAATGSRTSLSAIRGLLRCDWENVFADDALNLSRSSSGSGHGLLYHMDDYPENCADENLLHGCQSCHLRYDQKDNQRKSRVTRFRKQGQEDFGV